MDALEWDDDEIVTRARSWAASTGGIKGRRRLRLFGMQAVLRFDPQLSRTRLVLSAPGPVRAQYVYGDDAVDEAAETRVLERVSPVVAEAVLAAEQRATERGRGEGHNESIEVDLADLLGDEPEAPLREAIDPGGVHRIADASTYSGFHAELTSDSTSDGEPAEATPGWLFEEASPTSTRRRPSKLGRMAAAALVMGAGGLLAYQLAPTLGASLLGRGGGQQAPLAMAMSATALAFEATRHHSLEHTAAVVAERVERMEEQRGARARGRVTIEVATAGAHVVLGRRGTRRGRKSLYGPWPQQIDLDPAVEWEILAARPGFVAKAFAVSLDDRGEQRVVVKLPYDPSFQRAPEDIYED